MTLATIRKQTARRFVLGRQGLWPGRRYAGKSGVAQAIRASECVQVDTINIIHRSHDLTLFARVSGYQPEWLHEACYGERQFFDYGTILMLYPIADLPCFQTVMQRLHQRLSHVEETAQTVRQHVLEAIAKRGPLANRDFTDRERIPGGFNHVKDTSSALYHLYLSGHVMTSHRRNFERVYDLAHNVHAPTNGNPSCPPVSVAEAERFFALKAMRDLGLATGAEWARRATLMQHERIPARTATKRLDALVSEGALATVEVEGIRETCYLPAEDAPLLAILEADEIPAQWQPVHETTNDEVTFLAPLDNVIWDRARTASLFDFEYVWEVYKPAATRKWGYYTLPILFGDRLVGRMAFRLDRKTQTLFVEGFWLEENQSPDDTVFQQALRRGLARFSEFHNARRVSLSPDAKLAPELRVLLNSMVPNL